MPTADAELRSRARVWGLHDPFLLPACLVWLQEAQERLLRDSSIASAQQEAVLSSGAGGSAGRLPAPAPLDVMEAQANRLYAITSATCPEDVVSFWKGALERRASAGKGGPEDGLGGEIQRAGAARALRQ